MTFSSAADKRSFVRRLFSDLAPRYETVNWVLSLGMVGAWRRYAAAQAQVPPGGQVLDVAAGEGALSRTVLSVWPTARVVSLDFVPEMVRLGRARLDGKRVLWLEGDALDLPMPEGCFDAVVNSFMLRNVTDVELALSEQTRVVKPGGRVVCLEMTWPRNPIFRPLFRLYFGGLVPVLGWLLTGSVYAYRYLPRSVEEFLRPDELSQVMERVGLRVVHCRTLALGTVTIHVGVKT